MWIMKKVKTGHMTSRVINVIKFKKANKQQESVGRETIKEYVNMCVIYIIRSL